MIKERVRAAIVTTDLNEWDSPGECAAVSVDRGVGLSPRRVYGKYLVMAINVR